MFYAGLDYETRGIRLTRTYSEQPAFAGRGSSKDG